MLTYTKNRIMYTYTKNRMGEKMKKELTIENINTGNLLGVALKRLRKQRELSQEELARGIGIRQATVSDIENGRGGSLETFLK